MHTHMHAHTHTHAPWCCHTLCGCCLALHGEGTSCPGGNVSGRVHLCGGRPESVGERVSEHTHQQCLHRCSTQHISHSATTAKGTDCTRSRMQGSTDTAEGGPDRPSRCVLHNTTVYTSLWRTRSYMVYSVVTMTTEKKNP